MIRKLMFQWCMPALGALLFACSDQSTDLTVDTPVERLALVHADSLDYDPFQLSLQPVDANFDIPGLQSFASGTYGGNWVLIGGRKTGLHSMDNDPPSFQKQTANDSLWLVNLEHQTVVGVPVPQTYARYLYATNMQDYQVGEYLYLCGGYTTFNPDSTRLDWTSDHLFEIHLPGIIQYIQSGGATPTLDQVFTKVVQSPFVQVTGGEMMVVNDNFYLIGGQKFNAYYDPGTTGTYTDAIRKFNLTGMPGAWSITDTFSLVDPMNLHRRDFILVPAINNDQDSLRAVIYGGVFTPDDGAYQHPVYISGLADGQPAIYVDSMITQVGNLYTCATVLTAVKSSIFWFNHHTFLGGISYMYYDSSAQLLKVPPPGEDLPFSNLINSVLTDGATGTREMIQLPPHQMLPAYLGSNARFFANPTYLMPGAGDIMDMDLIFPDNTNGPVAVGYMVGGIRSDYLNSITPNGIHTSYANPTLYRVLMEIIN